MDNKISDSELLKISILLEIIGELETNLQDIQDPEAYGRIKDYVNERCVSKPLSYKSPFIIEVK